MPVSRPAPHSTWVRDLLALLFGTLFGVTAIAFLLYVHKHRTRGRRPDAPAAKPSIIYVAATTTEEHAGEDTRESS
ncbi:UNVERIFIED_CONTAM: hypothetical protein K2H54_068393 [Gekko kuhli]